MRMNRGRRIWIPVLMIFLICVVALVALGRTHASNIKDSIPLAEVKRGNLPVDVYASGELTASRFSMITAPAIGGDALRITTLSRTGVPVKKGDVIVEFDPSEQRYKLEQNHSQLMEAEQEITKAKADALVLAAEDKVALLKAKYGVRRSELDVEKNELVSKIDADKNNLALEQARRVQAELNKDISSHHATSEAAIFLAQEKYNKAKLAMDQAQQNLEHMRVVAPMDGLVSIQKNMSGNGGFFFTGMSLPDYRAGDQVYPGSAIAQILDPAGVILTARVSEVDHDNVKQNEDVDIRFDSIAATVFKGSVQSVGGMTGGSIFNSDTSHGFDATIRLSQIDPRLRPGLTAHVVLHGNSRRDVLYVPRQALFLKDGKRIAYVKEGGTYRQREVKVECETESRAAVEGLEFGVQVALIDPTAPRKQPTGVPSFASEVAP